MSYKYLALPAQEGLQRLPESSVGLTVALAHCSDRIVSLYSRATGPSSSENSLRSGNRRRHRSGSPPRNSGTDPVGEHRSIQRSGFESRRSSQLCSLEARPSEPPIRAYMCSCSVFPIFHVGSMVPSPWTGVPYFRGDI